tara:strand:- start:213 stop:1526 length:1314 start_codon:yes stop_codon:yes gene_type:complete
MTTEIDKDTWSKALYQFVEDDAEILPLEKATDGRTTMDEIGDALEEYKKLYKAGIASKAEILTLSRAFPDSPEYTEAAKPFKDIEPMVVGGPASVELIDREGHMITSRALKKAFGNYMKSFRTRNAMVLHSDVQVGWCLPAYISKGGQIFKSGVDDKGLFFVCEIRDDTRIAKRVMEQVNEGKLKSYSIAGSATKVENVQKGLVPYMRVDDMELAEVTVCEKGVNQSASFDLLKAEEEEEGKEELKIKMPDLKIKKELFFKSDTEIDFLTTFVNYNDTIINKAKDPLTAKESFTTLHNTGGRIEEHNNLLDRMKFPNELAPETLRYATVIHGKQSKDGKNIVSYKPGIVNQAGEMLGDKHDEDAPTFKTSDKNKSRQKTKTISITKTFLDFEKRFRRKKKSKKAGIGNLGWAAGILAGLAMPIAPKYNPETSSFEWN